MSGAGTQSVSFRDLVEVADESALRCLVPDDLTDLIASVDSTPLDLARLRRLVMSSGTARDYLIDTDFRQIVLGLLGAADAKVLASRLGLPLDADPHSALLGASSDFTIAQVTEVLAFFGADEAQVGAGGSGFEAHQAVAHYPLFRHQRQALDRVRASLYSGARRVVLHMPTGAGKTRTAMHAVAEHLRIHEPTVVVWLASSEELLQQAASEFETAWAYLGNRTVSVTRYWGSGRADLTTASDGLVVAGLSKMYAAQRRDTNFLPCLGDATSLVVMDEAHQSVAETYALVLDVLSSKRPETSMLGLTATPGRTYSDVAADRELSQFWSGSKVMLEIPGYSNPVSYLMDEGYLARPTFRIIESQPNVQPSEVELGEMSNGMDAPTDFTERLGLDTAWNTTVLRETEQLLRHHRRVIVFATTVRQARTLSAAMRAMGHSASAVTGSTPKHERESILRKYTSNSETPMALFNYGVLTTGFDAPSTSAAVIARPTKSLVLYSQMIGRALRGPRAGGNSTAEIVSIVDPDLPGFGDPAEAFTNWEDVWS